MPQWRLITVCAWMLATAAHAAPITLEQVDSGAVIQTTVVKDIVTNPSLEDSLFRQGG